jgi:hypothetical protein
MVPTGASTLGPVLQQGCSPGPRWHSPAIFLQQAISASVIWLFGRQASAGAIVHKNSKLKTAMGRTFAIHRCYNSLFLSCKFTATARDAEERIIYKESFMLIENMLIENILIENSASLRPSR